MDKKVEQRTVLSFLSRVGNKPIDCWRQMRQVFGTETMSVNCVRVWHRRFQEGRTDFKDNKHTERPRSARSAANIQKVRDCLQEDQRSTVHDIIDHAQLSKTSVHAIIKKDLGLSKVAPKVIPKLLTDEQKCFRVRLCEENLALLRDDPNLMSRVVTGDESWISVLEVETKQSSCAWVPKGDRNACPTKAKRQRGDRKAMLTIFFDFSGPVLTEFLALGATVDADEYCLLLKRLKENIRRKRPNLWG